MNVAIAKLEAFAKALFQTAGMEADKAATVAQLLVLTDAMGRRTHGLAMAPLYLAELAKGTMAKSGEPEVPWLLDHEGHPTTDPRVLEHSTRRGSLQLIGGLDHGHKGFGLALMVEALSQGLAGHGRLDAPKRWGGNTYLQVIDPELFAGRHEFARLMDHFGDRCRSNKPIDPARPVRLPGDAAARALAAARRDGIAYDHATRAALQRCACDLGVPSPLEETH